MTSLIFWGPYLAHKGVVSHRREKQRVKNYERWEGLRDEYDEQRKVARETRSLDIQRTGTWDTAQPNPYEQDRAYISLRDQQEANDARTGWRPQESWEPPRTQVQAQMTGQMQQTYPQAQRHASTMPTTTGLPLKAQKTGATWDEGLPAPLAVSRRSFEDYDHTQSYRSAATSSPVSRQPSQTRSTHESRQASTSISRTQTPSGLRASLDLTELDRRHSPQDNQIPTIVELPKNEFGFVEPTNMVPGGRMAELIERGY